MTRPTEQELMMMHARMAALRSTCPRLQVGAVLAHGGHVIGTGRNGTAPGEPHCVHQTDEPCSLALHAERNAVAHAARYGVATAGATLYVTHSPCLDCAGVLLAAGIAEVFYETAYRDPAGLKRLAAAGVPAVQLVVA